MSNSISAAGRLVADAELSTAGSTTVLKFKVASDVGFGEKKVTNWFNCAVWGKRGESLERFLRKGSNVTIYGVLSLREFEHNGVKRISPDVNVFEVDLQGGTQQKQSDSEPAKYERKKPPVDDIDDDQIPF